MYKAAAILYLVCFFCYILFSRTPDYFEGEFVRGVVAMDTNRNKSVKYRVGSEGYTIKIAGWGANKVAAGDTVRVIFDPSTPSDASLYSFFSYWLKLSEILVSAVGFIVLFFAAVFITGREHPYINNEEDDRKKRKYEN